MRVPEQREHGVRKALKVGVFVQRAGW